MYLMTAFTLSTHIAMIFLDILYCVIITLQCNYDTIQYIKKNHSTGALSLAAQCIVIGPVCVFVCLWVCYYNNLKLCASILTKLGL